MAKEDIERLIDRYQRIRGKVRRFIDEDLFETVEEVFDYKTVLTIYDLINSRCLAQIKGVVSAGKESRVYWGKGLGGEDLAIKIYLTSTAEFRKSILKYIVGDPRFEGIKLSSTKKLMSIWARKEFSNLKRMWESGVRVPKPYCVKNNVLVMEFIGKDGVRAPLLKEVKLTDPDEIRNIFMKIMKNVRLMYKKAMLVHADLSEYNVMLYGDDVVIIDVSQAVHLNHPQAFAFLVRDLSNVRNFFMKLGLATPSLNDLINYVIGEDESLELEY
ncbi:MAG TPA: serine protein kinase RIO [Acidilobales archaeon]|nr:serine protein kinase RIO [Acidilobales archaeon]